LIPKVTFNLFGFTFLNFKIPSGRLVVRSLPLSKDYLSAVLI